MRDMRLLFLLSWFPLSICICVLAMNAVQVDILPENFIGDNVALVSAESGSSCIAYAMQLMTNEGCQCIICIYDYAQKALIARVALHADAWCARWYGREIRGTFLNKGETLFLYDYIGNKDQSWVLRRGIRNQVEIAGLILETCSLPKVIADLIAAYGDVEYSPCQGKMKMS